MGKLIVTEFVTLDGAAQAPGGPDEDRDGGFAHGGWQAPLADQESGGVIFEEARSMDALLLGRRTYEIFAGYWPSAPQEIPFTRLPNGVPKYVASRTLAGSLAWQPSTLVAGDLAENITALKGRHDEVHVIGSLDLLQSLLRFGLCCSVLTAASRCSPPGPCPRRCASPNRSPTRTARSTSPTTAGGPTYGSLAIEEQDPQLLTGGDERARPPRWRCPR